MISLLIEILGANPHGDWNEDQQLQRHRISSIASKIPFVVMNESPTLRMYLAVQMDNLGE